jgi:hypothetical protein
MNETSADPAAIGDAIAYVIELYRELSTENGAPTPGTQNQAVDFIRADPELSRAVRQWGERNGVEEAKAKPPPRLTFDETYHRVRAFLVSIMEPPVFEHQDRG